MTGDAILALAGLIVLMWRTRPWRVDKSPVLAADEIPLISIIIPCRNEENNIARLLRSLKAIRGVNTEVLVVDDSSTDRTAAVAREEGATVLSAPEKPAGWVGKSWACWNGAKQASGYLLLFTDADTTHSPDSLVRAVSFLKNKNADLISAPPYHLCRLYFERFLGLFHLLPLIASGFNRSSNPKRVFAIGQYLLINKGTYFAIGGHEALRGSLTEDIDMAKAVLEIRSRYEIFPEPGLYSVQMYDSADEFIQGWKRLLRLGMKKVTLISFVEVTLVFYLFLKLSWLLFPGFIILWWLQRKHGQFSVFGVPLAILSIGVFTILSVAGALDTFRKRQVTWQGRSYADV